MESNKSVDILNKIRQLSQGLQDEKIRNEILNLLDDLSKESDAEAHSNKMYFNAPISYQSLDPEGDFLDVNEYWCTILGYKKEDVIGRNFSYFLVGDAKDSFKKNFNYFKNNGVIDGVEFEMRRKDGRHIFVRFSGVIEANESDDMICSHCVMSDITESIAEERFIRKELETVNKYLNLAGSFIVVIGRDQKVEFINNKGCEILQKERSKVIGTNWFDGHLVGEDVEMIKAYFNDIIAGKADLEEYFENKIITESGDHRLISWKNSVIRNNEGKIVGTISSGDDITEKYQFELKLQENQRMLKERNDEYATVNEELRQKNNEYQSLHEEYSANNEELHKLNEKLRDQYRLLKESEHLFRTVVKSSLPIIFRLDENGDFLLSEGRSLTKLGLSPGQVVGQSVYDVYKDFPEVLKAVKETYKGKETRPVVKLPGIAGDTFFDTSFSPIIDEERKIVGVVGMAVDITEERQARQKLEENEIELKKQNEEYLAVNEELKDANNRIIEINQYLEDSKKQFETIVEHMIDALFVFNEQSEIVEQNAAARKMFGIKLDESLLIGFGDLLHDDNLKFEEIMQGVRVYGKFAGEYSGKINGGKHIDLDISATSIRLRGEEHFLLIMRDISENKKKEQKILDNERKLKHQNEEYEAINEELREVNERLNKLNVVLKDKQAYIDSIITAAPAGILVEMERIIHFANDEACKITGYEASELSNMSAELLYFSKEEYIRVGKLVMKDISEVRYSRVETSWRRKDGEAVSVLLSASLIDSENPDMGVTVVVLDITAIKQYEGQLKIAKQKAEESDNLKSAFLANMSHEIRTPMNSILGFAGLLENEDLSMDKRKKFINIINTSSNQLMTIISDIVDISKIEAGQIDIISDKCDIHEAIEEILEQYSLLNEQTNAKNVKLQLDDSCLDSRFILNTDVVRLKQILGNLISNSIKFTQVGSIEIGCLPNYDTNNVIHKIMFFVRDTGEGISPENHEIIFQRFRQEDGSNNRTFGGTGLGLAISKALVELLGGEIWVESEKGKGTTFFFTIANKDYEGLEPEEVEKIDKDLNYNWKGRKILLVDDYYDVHTYFKELLEETEVQIICAYSSDGALKEYSNNKDVDLVLMDIQLPDKDGYETTKLIHKQNPDIPIIAQTAFALSVDREKCLKAGCVDYLSKPVSKVSLFKAIAKHLP